ncbi:hypothetical protein Tco_1027695 [Tanacetum coccineum]
MDNPNITMEEYIRLEEEKARKRGKVYNWETATYDMDNGNDKIDIEQPSGDMSVMPLPNVINVNAQGSNKLLETSHDTSTKSFKTETFIKKLNVNIMTCNLLNNGILLNLIKNLYVPFGIPFDLKLFYKDGVKLGQV